MAVEQTLAQFAETDTGEAFSLQNSKLLKVELSDVTIQAKLGSMMAYQGRSRSSTPAPGACRGWSRRLSAAKAPS
jgi:hypothetical protein